MRLRCMLILVLGAAAASGEDLLANSTDKSDPKLQPYLNLAVSPGHNLWVDEDLILECRVYNIPKEATAVWLRALLDPAGRRLRLKPGGGSSKISKSKRHRNSGSGDNSSEIKRRHRRPFRVRERITELLSHGEMLLLNDDRFKLDVTRYEDCVVYRLELRHVHVNDSGDYECQVTGYDVPNSLPAYDQVLNRKIEINVFEKGNYDGKHDKKERNSPANEIVLDAINNSDVQNDGEGRGQSKRLPWKAKSDVTPESTQHEREEFEALEKVVFRAAGSTLRLNQSLHLVWLYAVLRWCS